MRRARTLLDWAMERGSGHDLEIVVPDGDRILPTLLDESGFDPAGAAARPDTGVPEPDMAVPEPKESEQGASWDDRRSGLFHTANRQRPLLPVGYRIRPVGLGEEPERIDVHRRAWKPITLPWPEDAASFTDPAAESSFRAEHFDRLTQLRMYSPDRDFVVEAPDGSLAACCTLWWRPALGTVEIEPLGVLPEHRR